ncbi:MAG: amidohydrolase family protein, partial [Halobacteriota archaeon]
MAEPADVVFVGGEVHTLTTPDETAEAVAVSDGRIARVTSAYESQFVTGAETTVVDLEGRVLLPGFIDAHTHMQQHGQSLVHADLAPARSLEEALERLAEDAAADHAWLLGFGWDESEWGDDPAPTRDDLDAVSTDRPIAAFRVDLHSVALNSIALERLRADLPDEEVQMDDGEPTGRVVESAVDVVWDVVAPDEAETRELLRTAIEDVHSKGVTGVHDMVRQSHAPRAYRDLDAAGDLDLRV